MSAYGQHEKLRATWDRVRADTRLAEKTLEQEVKERMAMLEGLQKKTINLQREIDSRNNKLASLQTELDNRVKANTDMQKSAEDLGARIAGLIKREADLVKSVGERQRLLDCSGTWQIICRGTRSNIGDSSSFVLCVALGVSGSHQVLGLISTTYYIYVSLSFLYP